MIDAPDSPYRVPYDGSFRLEDAASEPREYDKARARARLRKAARQLGELQRKLRANDTWAALLVFQGMDASGKDGTIRAMLSETDPTGCEIASFKTPTRHEFDHDFLWRVTRALPQRGHLGIFNRSHYEEVLIVRVHPALLQRQQLPGEIDTDTIWDERLRSIRDYEEHLARNGVAILKFWLNVSAEEQRKRFLSRLENSHKIWKFNPGDIRERRHWAQYMQCYEQALNATSRPWAPWYAIPADRKPYMRAVVTETVVAALSGMGLRYPQPTAGEREEFEEAAAELRQ